jgi:ubiquitin carboxyl-terminal hydrolase L5
MNSSLPQPQTSSSDYIEHDLVGGPFAVIESDPGVFSSFIRSLGVGGLQVVELYDIEPWAVDHLSPHGLVFCFLWHNDVHRPADFGDPDAERVWFANQLSDDACASLAILNVLLNTSDDVHLGSQLREFKADTERLSSVVRACPYRSLNIFVVSMRLITRCNR